MDISWALVLNLHQPAGNLDDLLAHDPAHADRILWAMDRIPRVVRACDDVARVHLSLSGTLLESLTDVGFAHRAAGRLDCAALLGFLRDRRVVEALGTGYYHPVLPLVPHNDWDDQLERWQGIGHFVLGRRDVGGFWPPEAGFTMELIPELRRLGYQYVIVDSEHVEPETPMSWHQLRYRPHVARFGPDEIVVVVRDRELSSLVANGTTADTFLREVVARTEGCDDPLVTTCVDGEYAPAFCEPSPAGNFWTGLHADLVHGARHGHAAGLRPRLLSEYLRAHGTHGVVTVGPGTWSTPSHGGTGFVQWSGSWAQREALVRLDEISQAVHAARANAFETGDEDPTHLHEIEEARWRVLRAETSCNFFWGDDWVQRCHDDLDEAVRHLGLASYR